ncbi:DUF1566 domain-containing protein [Chitinivorax sp. B]|uniref:Lcl domain-containing protein n=1 Tax=Chitinivorax sp. B TaxID=2502235 RepID=UPI0014859184|nr:DUF1566 domain-containing protein [Chitinivorax sp. B]
MTKTSFLPIAALTLAVMAGCNSGGGGTDATASSGVGKVTPPASGGDSSPTTSPGTAASQLPTVAMVASMDTPQTIHVELYKDAQGTWRNWRLLGPQALLPQVTLTQNQLQWVPTSTQVGSLDIQYSVEVVGHPQYGTTTLNGVASLHLVGNDSRYAKLDARSKPLPDQTAQYEAEPWPCVFDREQNAVWLVNNNDAKSPFYRHATYRWGNGNYHSAESVVGKCALDNNECDTDTLVETANRQRVCGYSDWRLPSYRELDSLVNMEWRGPTQPAIDTRYFPDTLYQQEGEFQAAQYVNYWSGTTAPPDDELANQFNDGYVGGTFPRYNAFTVIFGLGRKNGRYVEVRHKGNVQSVRLVRGGRGEPVNPPVYRPEQAERPAVMESFVKLDETGKALPGTAGQWACIEDKRYTDRPRTLWQLQQGAGRDQLVTQDELVEIVVAANREHRCGRSDWRMPTQTELASLLVKDTVPQVFRAAYVSYFHDLNVDQEGTNIFWSNIPKLGDVTQLYRQFFAVDFGNASTSNARIRWENANQRFRVRLIATDEYQPAATVAVLGTPIPEEVARKDRLAFRRLAADGKTVIPANKAWGAQPWHCAEDLRYPTRGRLLWAMKQSVGGPNLHHPMERFAWGSTTNPHANCSLRSCNVDSYIAEVNRRGLCGRHDWRLPTVAELRTLTVKDTLLGLTYRPAYLATFPDFATGDHTADRFWSASEVPGNPLQAYSLAFNQAGAVPTASNKTDVAAVRLVAGEGWR